MKGNSVKRMEVIHEIKRYYYHLDPYLFEIPSLTELSLPLWKKGKWILAAMWKQKQTLAHLYALIL